MTVIAFTATAIAGVAGFFAGISLLALCRAGLQNDAR